MEKHHRELIQKNYLKLVQHCNISVLLPVLVQKRVFSPEMIVKYMTGADYLKRKRDLFLDVQMRGPQAFMKLVESLRETHQIELANSLQPSVHNNHAVPKKHATPFLLPTNEDAPAFDPQEVRQIGERHVGNINLGTEPLRIHVKLGTRLLDDPKLYLEPVYSTHSKNRGVALIINNIKYINDLHPERRGAEIDGRNLEELFYQIGLHVESYVDLTAAQMEEVVLNFRSSPRVNGVDMAFVIIMGHGQQNSDNVVTDIIGIDNNIVTTSWVEEQFDNVHCKGLQKIPKVIIYQACRGKIVDHGVASRTEADSAAIVTLRTRSDMLIANSTLPGTASHRDIFLGTWYINLFCETMMNLAHATHMENIFKMLDEKLSRLRSARQTMQTSMFMNMGFKTCFVHPGIYVEDGQIKNLHEVLLN